MMHREVKGEVVLSSSFTLTTSTLLQLVQYAQLIGLHEYHDVAITLWRLLYIQ